MNAISELLTRCAPMLAAVGACWHSRQGLALANAIVRQQSRVSKPVIRSMPSLTTLMRHLRVVILCQGCVPVYRCAFCEQLAAISNRRCLHASVSDN